MWHSLLVVGMKQVTKAVVSQPIKCKANGGSWRKEWLDKSTIELIE